MPPAGTIMAKVGRCVDASRFLQGYFWNGEWMIPLYLLVLGVLQLLCVIWLFDIAKGVYAFVVYGEADDHRSDDEDEDGAAEKKRS